MFARVISMLGIVGTLVVLTTISPSAAGPRQVAPTAATPLTRPVYSARPIHRHRTGVRPNGSCVVSGLGSFVGGGLSNVAGGDYSGVLEGQANTACDNESAIAGGLGNDIYKDGFNGAEASFIGGGANNVVSAPNASIGSGSGNTVSGSTSAIGGGGNNLVAGLESSISAGDSNQVFNNYNAIGGGASNYITSNYDFLGAGTLNDVGDSSSIIGAGNNNSIVGGGQSESIVGGDYNQIGGKGPGSWGSIDGGYGNQVSAFYASILGGQANSVVNEWGVVGGGYQNAMAGAYGAILGGQSNSIIGTAEWAVVGGGQSNSVSGNGGFIGAGYLNIVAGVQGFVGEGTSNAVNDNDGFIGGGAGNFIHGGGVNESIVGGTNNQIGSTAVSSWSSIGGGYQNLINTDYGTIGGGYKNQVTGVAGTIPGGYGNKAGNHSFAAGTNATAIGGSFVWADNATGAPRLVAGSPNLFLARASGGFTLYTNAAESAGVSLAAGSGTWASLSDRNAKTDIASIDEGLILQRVVALPISEWSYATEPGHVRHVGPMAQDFFAAFGVGEDDRHITTIDEGGVALAAVKGLNAKVESDSAEKDAKIAQLQREVATLVKAVAELEHERGVHH